MKQYILVAVAFLSINLSASAQTSGDELAKQLEQLQQQMQGLFENFSLQFGDENMVFDTMFFKQFDGNGLGNWENFGFQFDDEDMLLDTMFFKQFDIKGLDSLGNMQWHSFGNSDLLPENFSQQMQEMMEYMMKNFEGFDGFDGGMSPFFFRSNPNDPDSPQKDGLKQGTPPKDEKRKTHKL